MAEGTRETSSRVRDTAALARLALSKEECERLEPEFDSILTHLKALSQLDLEGVEATSSAAARDIYRADDPSPSLDPTPLLEQAPITSAGHYQVPRAVGGKE